MSRKSRIVLSLLLIFLSNIGFFLSAWIVLPAPTMTLLILGVGAPEVCPWLFILNVISFLLAWFFIHLISLKRIACTISLVGLLICGWELVSIQPTQTKMAVAMEQGLGKDYLQKIPEKSKSQMRIAPFVLTDSFQGIFLGEARHLSGIEFAKVDDVSLKMEVYQPPQKGIHPALVILYPGAWQRGAPANNPEFSRYMAARGYTVFAIDYRHAPRYRYPAQLDDIGAALEFIRQHATEYEANPERIAILGRSAGAHLGMLAAYQQNTLPIRAVVNYYGPVNLTQAYNFPPNPDPINTRAVLEAFIGGSPQQLPAKYENASPINYTNRPVPPTLLVYGNRDHVVEAKYGKQIYDSLQKSQNTAVLLEIPWAEHAFDSVFNGVSNQLTLYYTERFLAWAMVDTK